MHEAAHASSLLYPLINFALLVGALIYFLRMPVKTFVSTRHSTLKGELERVHQKLLEAQKQFQDQSHRLATLDAEVARLAQQMRSEAEAARVRILTEAKRSADEIIIDSKRTGEALMQEFRAQVRSDLAHQVISRAETHLRNRMTGDVRDQLRKDFSKQVESVR